MITPTGSGKKGGEFGAEGNGELFQHDGPPPFVNRLNKYSNRRQQQLQAKASITTTSSSEDGGIHYHPQNSHHHQHEHDHHNDAILARAYENYKSSALEYGKSTNNNIPAVFDVLPPNSGGGGSFYGGAGGGGGSDDQTMRWPSLVSLPASVGSALKRGSHMLSGSWRGIKQFSQETLDTAAQTNIGRAVSGSGGGGGAGSQCAGSSSNNPASALVYDCLMSELKDAMKSAHKLAEAEESEKRKEKNLPDYSWLMDPSMRERRRYKMPPELATQVSALCWRIEAEDCNKVMRRFRQSLAAAVSLADLSTVDADNFDEENFNDDEERHQHHEADNRSSISTDEDSESRATNGGGAPSPAFLNPKIIPLHFMKILKQVIAEREQIVEERKQQQLLAQQNAASADAAAAAAGQQQGWGEWIQEKFTGSLLNLSGIAFGGGGAAASGGDGESSTPTSTSPLPPRTASNRVAQLLPPPPDILPTNDYMNNNGGGEGDHGHVVNVPGWHHQYQRSNSAFQPQQQYDGQFYSSPPHNNSTETLTSTDNNKVNSASSTHWLSSAPRPTATTTTFNRSLSANPSATTTHVIDFSQQLLNPAALLMDYGGFNNDSKSLSASTATLRGGSGRDGIDNGGFGGRSGDGWEENHIDDNDRRGSTISEESVDMAPKPADDIESRGRGWLDDDDVDTDTDNGNGGTATAAATTAAATNGSMHGTNNPEFVGCIAARHDEKKKQDGNKNVLLLISPERRDRVWHS